MIENDGGTGGKGSEKKPVATEPRFELEAYRKFIRDASPYISVIAGRRVKPAEAETMTDAQVTELALLLDARVKDLKKL